jgi:predicted amidophosphoribosyltransferase
MSIDICETCGSAFRGHPDRCPDCGAPLPERGEIRRLPHEVVHQFLDHAEEFLAGGPLRQVVLAFSVGSFIAFGAVLSSPWDT